MNLRNSLLVVLLVWMYASAFGQSAWHVEAKNIDPKNYYGVTLANGMVGIVSSAEPLKVKDVVLNGVYDYYQRGRVSNILKGFNHINMQLDIDQQRIGPKSISHYQQSLDMEKATLFTSFDVGEKATVKSALMSLRQLPYTALHIFTIEAKQDISITPMSVIEAPDHLTDVHNLYATIDRPHVTIPLLTSVAKSPSGRISLAASNAILFEEKHGEAPTLIHEDWDYNLHLLKFSKKLKKGQTYSFCVVASTCSSATYQDPHNEAERLTIFAALEGKERLLAQHNAAWQELWKSNITIDGDVEATRDIRFALYHLYSFAREGTALSLSPMGLSGLGYNGHVFWDTELWMYPPLLLLQPKIARSLLEYRFERLGAAKQNAFSHGYKGAMFPWESSAEGSEDTPVWALTGPFQHHISGCVAWSFWQYYLVTKDKEFLKTRAYPVLKEVADFWASRVKRDGPKQYHIENVIGANEWQENIDDNAFTNGMAISSLQYASQAALLLGETPNPDWAHVAKNIPILTFEDGVTKENATYKGEMIKQADVNLLAYPLKVITQTDQIKRDLEYYAPKYAKDGPAMGAAILAILYHRLGQTEIALQTFYNAYQPNKVPPFGVLSETAVGTNPYFATGAGGMLQSVIFGFGGLDIDSNGIQQTKRPLPKKWKKLTITGIGLDRKTYEVNP